MYLGNHITITIIFTLYSGCYLSMACLLLSLIANKQSCSVIYSLSGLFSGEALYCNLCFSSESWSDCDSTSKLYDCNPADGEDTCIKVHRLEKKGEKEIHHYSKSCMPSTECSGEECNYYGQSCRVDCCNTDACNGSVFLNANYMTFWMFAMVIIAH